MFALYLIGSILFLGLCIMIVSIRNAPRGYEDETGFHQEEAQPLKDRRGVSTESVVTKPLATLNVP